MIKSKKGKFSVVVLMILLATTLFCGVASAANTDPAQYYSFDFALSPGGYADYYNNAARNKISSASYAYFNVTTVDNPSGYPCYINVRSRDGNTRVGNAKTVSGTGVHYVYYKSGYGTVGVYYRPSAQTDSNSKVGAAIIGQWRP